MLDDVAVSLLSTTIHSNFNANLKVRPQTQNIGTEKIISYFSYFFLLFVGKSKKSKSIHIL